MPKPDTSGNQGNNSTRTASVSKRNKRFPYLLRDMRNLPVEPEETLYLNPYGVIEKTRKFICRVQNFVYFCNANWCITHLQSTYKNTLLALSLVRFYVRSGDQFAKLGGNASFYTYSSTF